MKVVEAKIIIPIDGTGAALRCRNARATGINSVTKIEAALYECEEILRESLGTKVAFATVTKNAKSVKS